MRLMNFPVENFANFRDPEHVVVVVAVVVVVVVVAVLAQADLLTHVNNFGFAI